MKDVQEMLLQLQKLQSAHIAVHEGRCAVVRNRHASCRRCAEACTTGCISIEDGVLSVDASKCIGCGTCSALCPTGALEACAPSDAELFKQCAAGIEQGNGHICIACEQAAQGADTSASAPETVQVACLGRVEESLMAMLAASGATQIELLKGDCQDCPYMHGEKAAVQTCATVNELFKAWQVPSSATLIEELPERAEQAAQETQEAAAQMHDAAPGVELDDENAHELELQKVGEDGTLPHAIPGRRRRLLAALDAAGKAQDVPVSTRLWGRIEIDTDKCESCQMCAVFCPTAAIAKFEDGEDALGVDHYAGRCVKCGSCVDICPTQAITLHDEVSTGDLARDRCVRYSMTARKRKLGGQDQAWNVMRELLKCEQVYNR